MARRVGLDSNKVGWLRSLHSRIRTLHGTATVRNPPTVAERGQGLPTNPPGIHLRIPLGFTYESPWDWHANPLCSTDQGWHSPREHPSEGPLGAVGSPQAGAYPEGERIQ
jgi:hypothetical protein